MKGPLKLCTACSRMTPITSKKLGDARCIYCNCVLHKKRQFKIYIHCKSCNHETMHDAFGWKKAKCNHCTEMVDHPTAKPVGAHKKGIAENKSQISLKLPPDIHKSLEKIAKDQNTSVSATVRFMTRIIMGEMA